MRLKCKLRGKLGGALCAGYNTCYDLCFAEYACEHQIVPNGFGPNKSFYQIMRIDNDPAATALPERYQAEGVALAECKKLATENPGVEFYVMKAVYRFSSGFITIEKLEVV